MSELDFFDIDKREGTWNPKPFVYPVRQYTTPPLALSSMPSLTFYNSQTFMPYHVDDDVDDSEDDVCTHWVQQYNDEVITFLLCNFKLLFKLILIYYNYRPLMRYQTLMIKKN